MDISRPLACSAKDVIGHHSYFVFQAHGGKGGNSIAAHGAGVRGM
jgi:hypothetical protein